LIIDPANPLYVSQNALQNLLQIERRHTTANNQNIFVALELKPARPTVKVMVTVNKVVGLQFDAHASLTIFP
jgi:hypothetical protein